MSAPNQSSRTDAKPGWLWVLLPLPLLILPLIAMQFTSEVDWRAGDFAVATALLLIVGVGGVLIARNRARFGLPAVLGAALIIAVLLIWAELAVGLF